MKKFILPITILSSMLSFGQKVNETTAAVMYSDFNDAISKGKNELALNLLSKAKDAVDQASANDETKESPKTLFFKGEIYMAMFNFPSNLLDPNIAFATSIESYKKAFDVSDKYDDKILNTLMILRSDIFNSAYKFYSENKFKTSSEFYQKSGELLAPFNVKDSTTMLSYYYAGITADKDSMYTNAGSNFLKSATLGYDVPNTYVQAGNSYIKAKEYDKSIQIAKDALQTNKGNKDLLMVLINAYISKGDRNSALTFLTEVINQDPNNAILNYNIGSIYLEFKEYEKAAQYLKKAIELSPNSADYYRQMASLNINQANDIKKKANELKIGDKNYDILMAKVDDLYKQSVTLLEKYIELMPNDNSIYSTIAQLYRATGNDAKYQEFKKKSEAGK